ANHGQHGAEDLFLSQPRTGRHVGEDMRTDEEAPLRPIDRAHRQSLAPLFTTDFEIAADARQGLAVDHRPDAARGIFGWTDLQAARRLDQPLEKYVVHAGEHDRARAGRTFLAL